MTRRTALFISPHLDDVVFSCGGLAALLSDAGWTTILATVFTRTVLPAEGFALACQLDKGLPASVDYMALRRQEDLHASAALNFSAVLWLDFPEAPHRGYNVPSALFGKVAELDRIVPAIAEALGAIATAKQPELVLAPQGLGAHVDHHVVIHAAMQVFPPDRLAFYRDTPYAIRQPEARPLTGVPTDGVTVISIEHALDRKITASAAYVSQIGFQFGGETALAQAMRAFASQEGSGIPAERFTGAALSA